MILLMVRSKSGINSPVEEKVVEIYHYIQGLGIHPRWLFGISEPSTVNSIKSSRKANDLF